jgi:hypothetical protein
VTSSEKTAPGRKTSNEHITFLTCCNADGSHRLKLLVIGKAKNPRAFKNSVLPVNYKATGKAWMTPATFKEWFHDCFILEVRRFLRGQNLTEREHFDLLTMPLAITASRTLSAMIERFS